MFRSLHVYWRGVSGAAVSVGVQVVDWTVEVLVGWLQQRGGAAAQRNWGTNTQQPGWAPSQLARRTSCGQSGRVSAEEAVAGASHRACGTTAHEPRGSQQRQGGLC